MKYKTHSDDDHSIEIKLIDNGFIVTHRHILTYVETYVKTLEELNLFLIGYYQEQRMEDNK